MHIWCAQIRVVCFSACIISCCSVSMVERLGLWMCRESQRCSYVVAEEAVASFVKQLELHIAITTASAPKLLVLDLGQRGPSIQLLSVTECKCAGRLRENASAVVTPLR